MSKIINEIKASLNKVWVFASIDITPNMAKELLELNTNNRPVKERTIRLYTEQMKKGAWRFNGDVIRLSKTGVLLDGQHRLLALIASGTTQKFNIQTGLPDEVFDVIDIGKNRSAADAVAMAGYKNSQVLQQAVKMILAYDAGQMMYSKGVDLYKRATTHDVIVWLESKNVDYMMECIDYGGRYYTAARFFAPGTYTGMLYLFSRKSKDAAHDFFHKLTTGEDISSKKDSAIWHLRQKFINMSGFRGKIDLVQRYAMLIKAWNFYRAGTEIKRISFGNEEDFPKIK